MLHLLGKGIMPEWNEEKHDRDEVFAFLCYRGIFYSKMVKLDPFKIKSWRIDWDQAFLFVKKYSTKYKFFGK